MVDVVESRGRVAVDGFTAWTESLKGYPYAEMSGAKNEVLCIDGDAEMLQGCDGVVLTGCSGWVGRLGRLERVYIPIPNWHPRKTRFYGRKVLS